MNEKIFMRRISPLPAPMESDGTLDLFALDRILEKQRSAGCAVCICPDRAERMTLRPAERLTLLRAAVGRSCDGRPTFFAVDPLEGENALRGAKNAEEAGADGLFVDVCRPLPRGFFSFVRKLASSSSLPLCVLKPPGRASVPCFAELAGVPTVAAVACLSTDPAECALLSTAFSEYGRSVQGAPALLGASDAAFFSAAGLFDGFFTPLSTLFPEKLRAALKKSGERADERALLFSFLPLSPFFSGDGATANLKWALHRQGLCLPTVRLPQIEPDAQTCAAIERGCARA